MTVSGRARPYSTDAVTPIAWVLARTTKIKAGTSIMQIPARTPACAAMTAMTLQALSGNRFLCGVGVSGPQVVEGWHGVPFGKPMPRTKEYIAIIRQILAREAPLTFDGDQYQIPYKGPDATGPGPAAEEHHASESGHEVLHRRHHPGRAAHRRRMRRRHAADLDVAGTAETAHRPIVEGRAKAGKPANLDGFDCAPYVRIRVGKDVAACRDALRPDFALYIGGMGARSKNYYNDLARRMGYEDAAIKIQDLYLDGKKKEAEAAVPDALIDEVSLVGPPERIKDRMQVWQQAVKDGQIGTVLLNGATPEALRVVAEAVL